MNKAAILIDGAFFLKRYSVLYTDGKKHSAEQVAKNLYTICHRHLSDNKDKQDSDLYRIFYYDCHPLIKKVHHPITGRLIDFDKHPEAIFRRDLFNELRKKRKVALRLGYLQDRKSWKILPAQLKKLLKQEIGVGDLEEKDVTYDAIQKQADVKIGIDITSLALKNQVDRIVLISGDGDFVPAAKLARREGIDFILDCLWNSIDNSLHEHIDGLRSVVQRPQFLRP